MEQDWQIDIVEKDVKLMAPNRGTLVLELKLNRTPDREWMQFFVSSGETKSGSMTFIAHQPQLLGNRIQMAIEDRDVESAASWAERSIAAANRNFEAQVITRHRHEEEVRQQQEAADAARLKSARDRLREADGN